MKKTNYAFVYVTREKNNELTLWTEKPHRNGYGTWVTNRGAHPLVGDTFDLLPAQMYAQHVVTVNDEEATPCFVIPVTLFDAQVEAPALEHYPSGDRISLNLCGEKLDAYVECDKRMTNIHETLLVLDAKLEGALDGALQKVLSDEALQKRKNVDEVAKVVKDMKDTAKKMHECVTSTSETIKNFHKDFRSSAVGEAVIALYNRIEMVERQKQNLIKMNANLNQQLMACEEAQVVLARENVELKENIVMYIKEHHKDLYKLLKDSKFSSTASAQIRSDAVRFETDVFAKIKKLERDITDISAARKANAEMFKQSRAKCRELSNIIDDCEKAFLKKKAEAEAEEAGKEE